MSPLRRLLALAFVLAPLPALAALPASGEAVYQRRCASCHESGAPNIPTRAAMKNLSVTHILRSLDFGSMAGPANPLRREDRDAVAAYLGGAGSGVNLPAK